jgi:hypothetical protein
MTMRPFGRVTPTQIDMLRLAGYAVDYTARRIRLGVTDEIRQRQMRAGRNALRRTTKQDFGYDLAAWHEFLCTNEDSFGYTHSYAFANVRPAIERAIRSRRRRQLVALLEAAS